MKMVFVEFTEKQSGRRIYFAGRDVRSIKRITHNGDMYAGRELEDEYRQVPAEEMWNIASKFNRPNVLGEAERWFRSLTHEQRTFYLGYTHGVRPQSEHPES